MSTINMTEVALIKVRQLLDSEDRDDLALRLSVNPGGCSGLSYSLFFDERRLEKDTIDEYVIAGKAPVEIIVDHMSLPYVQGATIDFSDTIEKQGFTIDNPNASGSCACGDSFS